MNPERRIYRWLMNAQDIGMFSSIVVVASSVEEARALASKTAEEHGGWRNWFKTQEPTVHDLSESKVIAWVEHAC